MTLLTVSILLVASGVAAYFDLTARRIPNWLTVAVFAYGLTAQTWMGGGAGLRSSLLGATLGGAILLAPSLLGGIGVGDMKFLAAIGGVVGPYGIILVFILASLAGGLLAIFVLTMRRRVTQTSNQFLRLLIGSRSTDSPAPESPAKKSDPIPYGIAISAGTWMFVLLWAVR